MPSLLVTVGSTQFPTLTDHVTNPRTLSALFQLGINHIVLQHGTHAPSKLIHPDPLTIHAVDYTNDFPRLLAQADIIVSHAGSGTVLEVTRTRKPLIVVVNSSLMDNHQIELAEAMSRCCCCLVLHDSQLSSLLPTIKSLMHRSDAGSPPLRREGVFAAIVAQELAHSDSIA